MRDLKFYFSFLFYNAVQVVGIDTTSTLSTSTTAITKIHFLSTTNTPMFPTSSTVSNFDSRKSKLNLFKGCEKIYDYLEMLKKGTNEEEMIKKLPCTEIKGRKAFWEHQHFQRSTL